MVGLGGLEPPTSPLSGVRSNQAELQTRIKRNRYFNFYLLKIKEKITALFLLALFVTYIGCNKCRSKEQLLHIQQLPQNYNFNQTTIKYK